VLGLGHVTRTLR